MSDIDLAIPDFLDRKKHPISVATLAERRAWLTEIGPKVTAPKAEAVKVISYERDPDQLTPGEQDELIEIKCMLKTSVEHAKRMAHEWLTRTKDRKATARRRRALKEVKGLR